MKKLSFIICFLLSLSLHAYHKRMSLQQALDRGLVEATATSLGAYQGFCMNVSIKNKTKDSLVILLEAGRRLNSLEDKNQDILIVKEEIIVLKNLETKKLTVKGYCCQASNLCPAGGARYGINKIADTNLAILARYLNTHSFDKNAEQEAVWAISDGRSAANITSTNDSLTSPLREMVSILKGEELPWYRLISKKYVYPNGVISIIPLQLNGTIAYSNDKENYATLSVKNEKGILVGLMKSEWIKACTDGNYKLELPLKGLAKGKYSIELNTPEKQLAKRDFEI